MTHVTAKVALQRFLASDESKAARQFLSHEMSRLSHLVLICLGDEVLRDELASGDPGDRNRPFDDWHNDLKKCQLHSHMTFGEILTSRTARSIAICTARLNVGFVLRGAS